MNNKGEHVLLYQFSDQARLEAVTRLLHHMNIRVTVLPDEAWKEKVGFLLGSNPIGLIDAVCGMLMQNIRNKRLDKLLAAWKEAGLAPVIYKAVVTPFNTLWTLKKLCQTMEKEHGAVVKEISEHEEQKALSEDVIDERGD